MEILLDIELEGDARPLETYCRAFIEGGKLAVYFQMTDANIVDRLTPEQKTECFKALEG